MVYTTYPQQKTPIWVFFAYFAYFAYVLRVPDLHGRLQVMHTTSVFTARLGSWSGLYLLPVRKLAV